MRKGRLRSPGGCTCRQILSWFSFVKIRMGKERVIESLKTRAVVFSGSLFMVKVVQNVKCFSGSVIQKCFNVDIKQLPVYPIL